MCLYLFNIALSLFFDLVEFLETETASNKGGKRDNNGEERKKYRCGGEPPVKRLCSVVEKLTPQFVETAVHFNIGGRVSVRCKRRLLLFGFVATRLGSDTIRLDFGTAGSIDAGRILRLRGGNAHRPCERK